MKKKIVKVVKMELPGGNAHPGPKLASAGVNMAKFCTDFNAKTGDRKGQTVPVIITAYEDKSYEFVIKTSPAAELILKAAGIQKVAEAISGQGGMESVNMQLAQQYLQQFGNLARTNNTMIIPSDLANVAGVIQACSTIVKSAPVQKA